MMNIRVAPPKLRLQVYIDGDIDGNGCQLVDCSQLVHQPDFGNGQMFQSDLL